MKSKLSLSIVAYKNYEDIKKAITSIENKTNKEIDKQIYIIDNGTKFVEEKDIEEFKKFLLQYNDIQYIDAQDNLGFGKAHNIAIKKADSDYYAIVNPDIILIEDSFDKIINYLNENQDVGMVIPKIIDVNGNIQKVYRKEVKIFDMFIRMFCPNLFPKRMNKITMQDKDYTKPFQVPFGQGSFLVARLELLKRLDGFDDRFFMYMEDADLCKRLNKISKLMYYPDTKVIHKWEKGSHKNKLLFKYHVKSMIKYFLKWKFI